MITKRELDGAIKECENSPTSYQNCEKLATFYTISDHLYGRNDIDIQRSESSPNIIGDYGESDFLQFVKGKDSQSVWLVIDELMQTLHIINPRLYDGVMRQLKGG